MYTTAFVYDEIWTTRFEELRVKQDREIGLLKRELNHSVAKDIEAEKALRQARDDRQALENELKVCSV